MEENYLELRAEKCRDGTLRWTSEHIIKLDIGGLINGGLVDLAVAQMLIPLNERVCRLLELPALEPDHEYLIEAHLYIKPGFKTCWTEKRQIRVELKNGVELVDERSVLASDANN